MQATEDRQIPVFLEILSTNGFVVHLPNWIWGHQQDQILRSTQSSWSATPWKPVNRTSVCKLMTASEDFARSNSYLKFSQQLMGRISFKQMRTVNQNVVSLKTWMVCLQA